MIPLSLYDYDPSIWLLGVGLVFLVGLLAWLVVDALDWRRFR